MTFEAGAFDASILLSAGSVVVGEQWVTVRTSRVYASGDMVVVATPVSQTPDPVIALVRNVGNDSFEVRVVQPGGATGPRTVGWMAINAGNHSFAGGRIDAYRTPVSGHDTAPDWDGQRLTWSQPFSVPPVVLGQVVSPADENEWSVFWSSALQTQHPAPRTLARIGRHRGDHGDAVLQDAELAVIAFSKGVYEINGWSFDAQVTPGRSTATSTTRVRNGPTLALVGPAGMSSGMGTTRHLPGSTIEDPFGPRRINFSLPAFADRQPERTSIVSINGDRDAARFTKQAGWGGSFADIREVFARGYRGWLDDQVTEPRSELTPYMEYLALAPFGAATNVLPVHRAAGPNRWDSAENLTTAWMRNLCGEPDQLRQRMTFCLSQIFVVSAAESELRVAGAAMADYYDTIGRHALGNFRHLLSAISYHPVMAWYLTYAGSRKPLPDGSRLPIDNFARELLQLFTIGLWELGADGTPSTTPTYGNAEVGVVAELFTGLFYGPRSDGQGHVPTFGEWEIQESLVASFLWSGRDVYRANETPESVDYYFRHPLMMYEDEHDHRAKTLFGVAIPASQGSGVTPIPDDPAQLAAVTGGLAQTEAALDILFDHPNTGPFLAKRLIQQMVTSNPTAAYVARVAAVFADDGAGVRGNLHAVARAVLLDVEARDWFPDDPIRGKLVEPLVRVATAARAFAHGSRQQQTLADLATPVYWDPRLRDQMGQQLLMAPSVFNFYSPEHALANGVAAPEAELLTPLAVTGAEAVLSELWFPREMPPRMMPDMRTERGLLRQGPGRVDDLLDRLDILITHGQMSDATRATLRLALANANQPLEAATILAALSPDAAVLL